MSTNRKKTVSGGIKAVLSKVLNASLRHNLVGLGNSSMLKIVGPMRWLASWVNERARQLPNALRPKSWEMLGIIPPDPSP